jgi:single-stranded-DNA-specific exonuclease
MEHLCESMPESMSKLLLDAAKEVRKAKRIAAFSHIDADGISALAIISLMLEREGKEYEWKNVHQINSESILQVEEDVREFKPDLVIFSDFGTGQIELVKEHILNIEGIESIVILDHHLPHDENSDSATDKSSKMLIEINPSHHGLSGSYDISGAGTTFLLALFVSKDNIDLSELAIVGATGDLQDYYGRGFVGLNKEILDLGQSSGYLEVMRDLTFFGIHTRPLPYLLMYATDPYLPGLTGAEEACYAFFQDLGIEMKSGDDWRTWMDLEPSEKQVAIQGIIQVVLEHYEDPRVAQGIIGDTIILSHRPPRTEMRSAKEFSTLLNACGRNRRPEVGVRVCMKDPEAFAEGKNLLQQHRANLASALRRLEEDGGFKEMDGMYVVDDPETPDTIIGIVIGMAQGSMIIPTDRPVIGVVRKTTGDSPLAKLSGRANRRLVKRGINLKDVFVEVAEGLNERNNTLIAEAGGHPMAAGAFIQKAYLDEYLTLVSEMLAKKIKT